MLAPCPRIGLVAILLVARICWASPETEAPPASRIVLFFHAPSQQMDLLRGVEREINRSKRYTVVLLQALTPLMRQADASQRVIQRFSDLMNQGRNALVALDHDLAQTKLVEARDLLLVSFVPYYDPRTLAQVYLELGRLALQRARPDQARQEFVNVHQLDATLKLDAHYSPQVRAAFNDAAINLPPPPVPSAEDLARIASLAGSGQVMVLSVEEAGGNQRLLKGSQYLHEKGAYIGVESRMIDVADSPGIAQQSRALGLQLRAMMESHLPQPPSKPRTPPATQPIRHPPPPPPPPPSPWYLRWYTLVAAGVVVAAAIVVPLALHEEHVDLTVTLPPPGK